MMTAAMNNRSVAQVLEAALTFRAASFDDRHETALRLFNGFTEGAPQLVIDLYARTAVIHNYADEPSTGFAAVQIAQEFLPARLPWVKAVVVKTRNGATPEARRGRLVYSATPDRKIREHGVWYAVDVMLNRDASLYLDTRNVRLWAKEHLAGKTVLNTFAYTGSLGVAAQAGGAARVVHLDLNRNFLNIAKTSYTLNGFPIHKADFQAGDFFPQIARLKAANERFDCVFVDPPMYSATNKGVVNLAESYTRVINKVRPLINDGGYLVAINNALFYAGADYLNEIEALCADGYLTIAEMIPVPADFIGNAQPHPAPAIADPAPFNHSTKIVVLHVRRKA
jgi:23S rRNA (cytosine1962-C5)-methyltransferase